MTRRDGRTSSWLEVADRRRRRRRHGKSATRRRRSDRHRGEVPCTARYTCCNSCEKKKTTFVGEPPTTPISVGSNLLQSIENFQYLGRYISKQSDIDVDIRARLGKAALVFQRLNRIWSNYSINSRLPSNFVSTHQSCYPQHCMYAKRGSQRRVSATPWMCSTVDVSERSWTVVARSCH